MDAILDKISNPGLPGKFSRTRVHAFEKNYWINTYQVQWNPALRTPGYYGQFRLSRQKAHIFSLKLTRLIRTTDTFLCPEWQTLIHRQPRFTDTGCMCLYAQCQFSVFPLSQLCASRRNNVPYSNNDRFLRVKPILLPKLGSKMAFDPSVFLPAFDPCTVVFKSSFDFLVI